MSMEEQRARQEEEARKVAAESAAEVPQAAGAGTCTITQMLTHKRIYAHMLI